SRELREVAWEAGVSAVLALRSPRRHWGHLFIALGLLGTAFRDEDIDAAEAFADQLALVLDTAELLERAVTVERTLAHAEKLAAVGETAARIAHDIRNPVTAARSLAQQLAPDAAPADRDAAGVILGELDRVERQVAALLRFSRREDFRFEPVDLGTLARATLEPLRPRLEAAQVRVELDAPEGIVARADGEKMRQRILTPPHHPRGPPPRPPGARRAGARGRGGRGGPPPAGRRQRPWRPRRRAAAALRAILLPQTQRHRPRTRHRQADGRRPRRQDHGRQRAGYR